MTRLAKTASEQTPVGGSMFPLTSWTAVVSAGQSDSAQAQASLTKLCQTYWGPVYTYVRRFEHNEEDAKDLTQEFFLVLLSKNYVQVADRTRGKFRNFLLTTVNHFLANEKDRSLAIKRGGGKTIVSLDEPPKDNSPRLEPASDLSPIKMFERQWAEAILRQAEVRLRQEYAAHGKTPLFEQLKDFLEARTDSGQYATVATQLNMTPGAVAVAVYRLRHRFGELVDDEIAQTLVRPTPAEIAQERRHLFEIFRR